MWWQGFGVGLMLGLFAALVAWRERRDRPVRLDPGTPVQCGTRVGVVERVEWLAQSGIVVVQEVTGPGQGV